MFTNKGIKKIKREEIQKIKLKINLADEPAKPQKGVSCLYHLE